MTTHVRRADATDIPWLRGELREFSAFFTGRNGHRPLYPGDDQATAILEGMVGNPAILFYLAERAPHQRLGFIVGMIGPHPFNPAITVLTELFWWVSPEHRGTSAGARLLETFVGYGKLNADWVIMTLEADSPVHPGALARRGFVPKESNYLLEAH